MKNSAFSDAVRPSKPVTNQRFQRQFANIAPFICELVWLLFPALAAFAQFPTRAFEIVESIPLETTLDNPDIRNTPEVWAEMISAAQHSLNIEQFYIANLPGQALEPIITRIEKTAARGVRVRILADARMATTYPETLRRLQKIKNIAVRETAVFNQNGGIQHAKFFIVDEREVFLGSQNFDWRALEHIHELGVRVAHPRYAQLMTALFELDWEQAQKNKPVSRKLAQPEKMSLTLNAGDTLKFTALGSPARNLPDGFAPEEKMILQALRQAKKSAYVQLLAYSPLDSKTNYYARLDDALRAAAARGVDVRLLISDWATKKSELPYLQSLGILPNLTVRLSTIPESSAGYLPFARVEHCKYLVVDDNLTWLGTSNWSRNYFYNSRNLGLLIENRTVTNRFREIFLKSWESPYAWSPQPGVEYPVKFYGEQN